MAASGAQDQLDKNPGYYQSLLGAHHDPKLVETICTGQAVSYSSLCSLREWEPWHTPNQPQRTSPTFSASHIFCYKFHLKPLYISNPKIIVSMRNALANTFTSMWCWLKVSLYCMVWIQNKNIYDLKSWHCKVCFALAWSSSALLLVKQEKSDEK